MNKLNEAECIELRPWLVDHRYGRSGRLQERIDRHLAGCDECRDREAFLELMGNEAAGAISGARLGFERKLDQLADYAGPKVAPGRYQRRFVTGLLGWTSAAIVLVGGSLPTARDSITWLGSLGLTDLMTAGLISAGTLIISSPLLLLRIGRRMEES